MKPKNRNEKPLLLRGFIAVAVVFCTLIPLPGFCVCGVCACTPQEQKTTMSASTCCQSLVSAAHSQHTASQCADEHSDGSSCACSCTQQETPVLPITPLLFDVPLQEVTPPSLALLAAMSLTEVDTFWNPTGKSPTAAPAVRLGLLFGVFLI